MSADPRRLKIEVGQSDEEREKLIEELGAMEDDAPPPRDSALTSEDEFAALQAQTLGAGALGTDPHTRR